jgi:hypothetical protein
VGLEFGTLRPETRGCLEALIKTVVTTLDGDGDGDGDAETGGG